MYKLTMCLLILSVCSFSQTPIPKPTGHPNAGFHGPTNIGDFDGDGSDDVFVGLDEPSGNTYVYFFGIYSMKKGQYLLVGPNTALQAYTPQAIGDFDGDKMNEIIVENIIYKYNSTLTKKKN